MSRSQGGNFPLGAIFDDPTKPSLPFNAIRRQMREGGPSNNIPRAAFAKSVDNVSSFQKWDYLGNDDYGTCVAAAWANQRRLVTKRLAPAEVYPTEAQAFQVYQTQNPKFIPDPERVPGKKPGKKVPFDKGMNIQTLLDYMAAKGAKEGEDNHSVKPVFYAKIQPKDIDAVRDAIQIFGSVWIAFDIMGVKKSDGTYNRVEEKDNRFRVVESAGVLGRVGGHSVVVGGHDPDGKFKCVTWASVREMEKEYWEKRVKDVWAVVWPEHIGTRNFMLGVDIDQLYIEYKRLTDKVPKLLTAPFSDVFFIKTANTQSGKVEVHVSRANAYYEAIPNSPEPNILSSALALSAIAPTDIIDVDNGNLYVIKTGGTKVEIQCATAASKYQTLEPQKPAPTSLPAADATNGKYIVDNADLYFIKTRGTTHGFVEISRAASDSNYQVPAGTSPAKTTLPVSEVPNGAFAVMGGNVFFIKTKNTKAGVVEISLFRAVDNFAKPPTFYSTSFKVADAANGTWDIGPNRDLYHIRQVPANKFNKTEIYVLPAETPGQTQKYTGEIKSFTSWVGDDDGKNGVWRAR